MARKRNTDRARLKKAIELRQKLVAEGAYGPSVEQERYLGIVVGGDPEDHYQSSVQENEQYEFVSEAEEIKERAVADGYDADILIATDRLKALAFISKVSITDVVLIGHGQLGRLNIGDSGLGWWHIARTMDHLKQGYFVQRHCGVLWQSINVAVGTFAVADMRNVIAPIGAAFQPQGLDDQQANQLLVPVYSSQEHTYEELTAQYPQFTKR